MTDLSIVALDDLRALRDRAKGLNELVVADLRPFLHAGDAQSFRRLPQSSSRDGHLSVASTGTALMALAASGALKSFYGVNFGLTIGALLSRMANDRWDSSGLPSDNAFTSVIALRSVAELIEQDSVSSTFLRTPNPAHAGTEYRDRSLADIATTLLKGAPQSLKVAGYPARPEIGYWLAHAASIFFPNASPSLWRPLAHWCEQELRRQISYVASRNHALIDPVAMAMAACLLQRVKRQTVEMGTDTDLEDWELPGYSELRYAIELFFQFQRDSLLWDSYFPLFHYADADSGANHCWAWEVLEAILREFPESIEAPPVFHGLKKALDWCDLSRLRFSFEQTVYTGWNAGGQQRTLARGIPECWASATVHMCLPRICSAAAQAMAKRVIRTYSQRLRPPDRQDSELWEGLLDSEVSLVGEPRSLKEVINEHLLVPSVGGTRPPSGGARSALLFGPPGTAKTTIARAVAARLGWTLLELSPSHFLDAGLENIYRRSTEIFDDLLELEGVVVLFDEMDALVQRRGAGEDPPRLDITQQFLTTGMLPKLGKLHDAGRVIFFFATNHRRGFDEAITRPGRFDLLLAVSPPTWEAKKRHLNLFLRNSQAERWQEAAELLDRWVTNDDSARRTLGLATFGELKALLADIARSRSLIDALIDLGEGAVKAKLDLWGANFIALRSTLADGRPNPLRVEFEEDSRESRVQT